MTINECKNLYINHSIRRNICKIVAIMIKIDYLAFYEVVTASTNVYILSVISDKISDGLKVRYVLY